MKKVGLGILLVMILLSLLTVSALADDWDEAYKAFLERTTPEYLDDLEEYPVLTGNFLDEYYGLDSKTAQSVGMRAWATCDKPMFIIGQTSTISVTATGGTLPYTCTYTPYRQEMSVSSLQSFWTYGINNMPFTGSFTMTPDGEYRYLISVTVTDAAGNYIIFKCSKYDTFPQTSLTDTNTVAGKVKAVVAEVITPGMTDYQKALALHDWLIYNANYDYTYARHDPDGVLLQGLGVCESYARAYMMMLAEVGIPSIYVSSASMNHAWNMIYVNGGWYHVDVTWDDPNQGGGYERHDYFCLTDAQMGKDHSWSEYDGAGQVLPASGSGFSPVTDQPTQTTTPTPAVTATPTP